MISEVTVAQLDDDPYPLYAQWRQESPVIYVRAVDLWFVTRWEDAETVCTSPDLFAAAVKPSPLDRTFGGENILTIDGPRHKQMRDTLLPSFRPSVVEEHLRSMLEPIVAEQFDALLAVQSSSVELMDQYFEPISVKMLASVLGLGEVDADTLRRWFQLLADGATNFEQDPEKQARADRGAAEIDETLQPILERMLRTPDGSVVSTMLQAASGTLPERMAKLMPTLKVILLGGMQEPGHGAGGTLLGMLTHAGQWDALTEDPDGRIRAAVNEGLRWLSPIGAQERHATVGAELAGVQIPPGANVAAIIASANRDSSVWGENADAFDLFRPERRSAAFGFGRHFCVGHSLSRVALELMLKPLATRFPGLALDPYSPPTVTGWEFRAPRSLRVLLNGPG